MRKHSERDDGGKYFMDRSVSRRRQTCRLPPRPGWVRVLSWPLICIRKASSTRSARACALRDGGLDARMCWIVLPSSSALPSAASGPWKRSPKLCIHVLRPSWLCSDVPACLRLRHSAAFSPHCPQTQSKPCGRSCLPDLLARRLSPEEQDAGPWDR